MTTKTEARSEVVAVYLEPTIRTALLKAVPGTQSESMYVRKLIINDLVSRGLLTHEMLVEVLT